MPHRNGLRQWHTVTIAALQESFPRCGCGGHDVGPSGMTIIWRNAYWSIVCAFDVAAEEVRLRKVA